MSASESVSGPVGDRLPRSAGLALRVVLVRIRFLFLMAGVLLLVASWPTLRGYWDRLKRPAAGPEETRPANVEYWCPMCPGVVSDWQDKCPICNMVLVRREKGELTPLPDGVVARMQFSPYRMQLAGIRTAAVEYRPLRREVVMVGTVTHAEEASALVNAEVFEKDLPFLAAGGAVEVSSDLLPGHPSFAGEVREVESAPVTDSRSFSVRLKIIDPGRELRVGMLVTARMEAPIMRVAWWQRAAAEERMERTAVESAARAVLPSGRPAILGGAESLVRRGVAETLSAEGLGLAVPHSVVIDHGSRKVAFVECAPGMFDAVEVTVGPRCGEFYPVLRGLERGQRVAVAGAFLLDAEMWLNHGLAATYFGATRGASSAPATPSPAPSSPSKDNTTLSAADLLLATQQKVCPVTGEPLDSMGGPVPVDVAGRRVFVCCKGCVAPLRKEPEKYLARLPSK